MTPSITASPPELRDALYALSIAKDAPDAALLDDLVRRFPQFGGELTDFAISIAIDALHGEAVVEAAKAALSLKELRDKQESQRIADEEVALAEEAEREKNAKEAEQREQKANRERDAAIEREKKLQRLYEELQARHNEAIQKCWSSLEIRCEQSYAHACCC